MADTITLKDGKWNLSKFQFYEYTTYNKSLVKIAEDKSISDVVITDAKMEVGEVYTENTKENIEKYNKNEYAYMYVKTDKFYYGYVMENMLEYLGGDTEIPPDVEEPEEPANPGIEYEKTIKSQTEYVENNNLKLSKAFTEINTELEKDDDLIASDLFDVDRCIEELKETRKRWASGGYLSVTRDNIRDVVYTKLPALKFEPSIYILSTKVNGDENILNMTINIDEGFKFRFVSAYNHSSAIINGVINMNDRWGSYTKRSSDWGVVKEDAYNTENIVLTFNDYGTPPLASRVSVDKWIAFE